MNTEINLLEKKDNRYIAPLFFGLLFLVGFVLVFGLLFFQKSSLNKKITEGQHAITEMEITLAEHHDTFAPHEKIERIEAEVNNIMNQTTPHVALYRHLISLLPKQNQLEHYQFDEDANLIIEAEFSSLDDVAHYVTKLGEQSFIIDTELSQVDYTGSAYEASLSIITDKEALVEEFDIE